ncbi:hypothetical protein [Methylobacterium nonmethylotrophicum]|uniref:Uncharacterized protein n=1 Tax=Methylobacterium nonmethylotrophicum TaxID=1141884 RepID=A0A4Z0NIH4_9HYPH|nr:hypothetical protein [Methylobacterium nonmethylotrophicum]TGD96058.1 hypothetical protein EU555_25190 [Methylobacterium nonmethylotrophicum]
MRDGSGRYGLGLAALAAVAIPLAVIVALHPRVGLLRSATETVTPPVRTPEMPADSPARPAVPARACPVCPAAPAPADPGPVAVRDAGQEGPDTRVPGKQPPGSQSPGTAVPPSQVPDTRVPSRPVPEIQVPDVTAERAAQRARLIGWTAHPDRVAGSAAALDLIGLVFTAPRDTSAGYRPLALDLSGAPDRAVVVLAEQPVTLTLATTPPDRVAALGVESSAAFSVAEGRPGLLAGFRALPFGASEVAPVLDPLRVGPGTLRDACAALRLWATQFGLPLRQARYTLIENPTRIALAGEALQSDGAPRGRVSGRRLARLCRV